MKKIKILTISVFIILALFIFVGCSSESSSNNEKSSIENTANSNGEKMNNTDNGTESTGKKEFTLEELKSYNGKNGNPAYVAVDGKVYDVTNVREWKDGFHQGNTAGLDLSEEINKSPHGKKILERVEEVGILVN